MKKGTIDVDLALGELGELSNKEKMELNKNLKELLQLN
jgi:hypothetical protein